MSPGGPLMAGDYPWHDRTPHNYNDIFAGSIQSTEAGGHCSAVHLCTPSPLGYCTSNTTTLSQSAMLMSVGGSQSCMYDDPGQVYTI